jgi:hypothetical protein
MIDFINNINPTSTGKNRLSSTFNFCSLTELRRIGECAEAEWRQVHLGGQDARKDLDR